MTLGCCRGRRRFACLLKGCAWHVGIGNSLVHIITRIGNRALVQISHENLGHSISNAIRIVFNRKVALNLCSEDATKRLSVFMQRC